MVADLLTRVAAIIPPPGGRLAADGASWAALDQLLDAATELLAEALGPDRMAELAELASPAVTGPEDGPVRLLLVERTLSRLRVQRDS
jgi:hypothetical protein